MWNWIWFAAGIFVGAVLGLVTTCAVVIGREFDKPDDYNEF